MTVAITVAAYHAATMSQPVSPSRLHSAFQGLRLRLRGSDLWFIALALLVGLIAGTTLALMRISLTGLEAVILFALVLAVLFASKAKLVIPAVIGAAALWGWLSLSIRIAA